jgi:hypothetical protein
MLADDEDFGVIAQSRRQISGYPADGMAIDDEAPIAREVRRPDRLQAVEKAHAAPSADTLHSPSAISM